MRWCYVSGVETLRPVAQGLLLFISHAMRRGQLLQVARAAVSAAQAILLCMATQQEVAHPLRKEVGTRLDPLSDALRRRSMEERLALDARSVCTLPQGSSRSRQLASTA